MERLTKISELLSFALRTNCRKSTDQNITGNYFKFIANCKFLFKFSPKCFSFMIVEYKVKYECDEGFMSETGSLTYSP